MQHSNSIPGVHREVIVAHSPANQAFRILQFVFVVAPVMAGLDKLTHLLANWDLYLAPQIVERSPIAAHSLMLIVGVAEVTAGLIVALRPKIGGMIVCLWLLGVVFNLLLTRRYFDIALRDFGLALGAFALARLAAAHERGGLDITYHGVARP